MEHIPNVIKARVRSTPSRFTFATAALAEQHGGTDDAMMYDRYVWMREAHPDDCEGFSAWIVYNLTATCGPRQVQDGD
jgi:hypothetical protein